MLTTIFPLFLNKIGATEVIIILVVILIFFGGKKIPELMRGMGRGMKEFKDAVNKDYSLEDDNVSDAEIVNDKQVAAKSTAKKGLKKPANLP